MQAEPGKVVLMRSFKIGCHTLGVDAAFEIPCVCYDSVVDSRFFTEGTLVVHPPPQDQVPLDRISTGRIHLRHVDAYILRYVSSQNFVFMSRGYHRHTRVAIQELLDDYHADSAVELE